MCCIYYYIITNKNTRIYSVELKELLFIKYIMSVVKCNGADGGYTETGGLSRSLYYAVFLHHVLAII